MSEPFDEGDSVALRGLVVRRPSVLVVEDTRLILTCLQNLFERDGFTVHAAASAREAYERLAGHAYDVVVLDYFLPDGTGIEILRRIRETRSAIQLPVIVLTSSEEESVITDCLREGANDFVHKPFRANDLLLRVKNNARIGQMSRRLDETSRVLIMLSRMIEARDGETGDHCARLARYAVNFGRILALPESSLEALEMGGYLHDIGKIAVPDSILNAPRKLTPEEWRLMQTHPTRGYEICRNLNSMDEVLPVVLHHHERYDGSGYPAGLAGETIPPLARLFQFVDIYDALQSRRPYKPPFSVDKILDIFREERDKGWRDPAMCETFLANRERIISDKLLG